MTDPEVLHTLRAQQGAHASVTWGVYELLNDRKNDLTTSRAAGQRDGSVLQA